MIRFLLSVMFSFFFAACVSVKLNYFEDDKRLAQVAVETFHSNYNDGQFEQIYDAAHPDAKATKSKDALMKALSGAKSTLGSELSSKLVKATVATVNYKEREVDLLYRTRFENGDVNEFFVVISDGNQGHLYSFAQPTDEGIKTIEFHGEVR